MIVASSVAVIVRSPLVVEIDADVAYASTSLWIVFCASETLIATEPLTRPTEAEKETAARRRGDGRRVGRGDRRRRSASIPPFRVVSMYALASDVDLVLDRHARARGGDGDRADRDRDARCGQDVGVDRRVLGRADLERAACVDARVRDVRLDLGRLRRSRSR